MINDCFGAVQLNQIKMVDGLTINKSYDVTFAVLSWEERALHAFLSTPSLAPKVTAIWFKSSKAEIEDRKVSQFESLKANFDAVEEFRLAPSTEIEDNFALFQKWIETKYSEVGRPLKILIDISCLPKNYLLFLLGLGFVNDYFACFDCVYSAGRYDLVSEPEETADEPGRIHRALISSGDWTPRQLPFFGGRDVFPTTKDLLVTVGGELGLTVPFVVKSEPRNLTLIFIQETAPSEETPMLESEKLAFRELMSEPGVVRADFGLNDAKSVANYCESVVNSSDADCVSMMALGSKSHALAVGLVGLASERVEVICRVPKNYNSLDVRPTGEIYLYEIEDRFEPLNYSP